VTTELVTAVAGLISGAILTYFKFRKDLEAEYDRDLRTRRLKVYADLWKHLKLVARYDRPKPLVHSTLSELTVAMRDWYFDCGGLYLSEEARTAYFTLKATIQKVLSNPKYERDQALDSPDITAVLTEASLLRARLSKDVGTRKSSPIADS
jgi:hypothetical protein